MGDSGTRPSHLPRTDETTPLLSASNGPEYSVFTQAQKRLIILAASLASAFSPLSANIYYPALNSIAKDLRVTPSQINLSITTYMICQGLAPTLTGSLADQAGRRPAYIFCFSVYILGNIALALQHWFPALLVLRAVQSCGSSGTVAISAAVAADIITSAERGSYMGIASLGNILAPSLGPIAGGVLSQYYGWQAIFWFLAIIATVFFVPFLLFFPETCRTIVGNGSIPPTGLSHSLRSYMTHAPARARLLVHRPRHHFRVPNPWATLNLLFRRPLGFILLANGTVFGSYYAITAGIPAQYAARYGLNDFQIGLCFIPAGLGSLFSATVNGLLVDWTYRRLRVNAGLPVDYNQKHDMLTFPIERARLHIGLPMIASAIGCIAIYGYLISQRASLITALVMVFLICFFITAAYNVMNVLIVDLNYEMPATAMAANNLVRCSLGAGAAATVNPLVQRLGTQWTYLLVSGTLVLVSPLLILVYAKGWDWRQKQAVVREEI